MRGVVARPSIPRETLLKECLRMNSGKMAVHPDALEPGTRVGRWRVVECLGVGGQGAVYRVEDMDHPGNFHALKLALRARDGRAEREVALMKTRVVHPHVVGFHGCARWPHPHEGGTGFVMDWVPGMALHQWAETGDTTFRQLTAAGATVALTLGELHARGVLHRDLKPEHILLRESDGQPVLLDFGVAWFEGAAPSPPARCHRPPCICSAPRPFASSGTAPSTLGCATHSSRVMTCTPWACACTGPPPGITPSPSGCRRTCCSTPSSTSECPRPWTSIPGYLAP
ncbi:protein kinase domain-containing protein [Cystobacter fuscus]